MNKTKFVIANMAISELVDIKTSTYAKSYISPFRNILPLKTSEQPILTQKGMDFPIDVEKQFIMAYMTRKYYVNAVLVE